MQYIGLDVPTAALFLSVPIRKHVVYILYTYSTHTQRQRRSECMITCTHTVVFMLLPYKSIPYQSMLYAQRAVQQRNPQWRQSERKIIEQAPQRKWTTGCVSWIGLILQSTVKCFPTAGALQCA
jgi:hypothetical protein